MESIEQAEDSLMRCIEGMCADTDGFFEWGADGTGHIGSVSLRVSRLRISSPWGLWFVQKMSKWKIKRVHYSARVPSPPGFCLSIPGCEFPIAPGPC